MNRESVIAIAFLIERPAQIKLFQLKIPREVKNIIGIETGVSWITGSIEGPPAPPPPPPAWPPGSPSNWLPSMVQYKNIVLGEIKLQSYEKASIFYTGELTINQNHIYADYTGRWFVPTPYTHKLKSHEDRISVSGDTTILQGVYRDKFYEQGVGNAQYIVRMYVWTEIKEDQLNI